jgi:hypothetical protein
LKRTIIDMLSLLLAVTGMTIATLGVVIISRLKNPFKAESQPALAMLALILSCSMILAGSYMMLRGTLGFELSW